MNKRQNQRLKITLKARPNSSSLRWISGRILIQALVSSFLLALFVAVAILAVHLITPSNTRSNNLGDLQIVSQPTPTPQSATAPRPMPANPNVVYTGIVGTISPGNSTQSVHPTPGSSPAPVPQLAVISNDAGSHSASRSKTDRKFAERERRNAERKRARLEAMYQSHLISGVAYKKGQDEYQGEITKYHSALNGTASTNE